MSEHQKKKNQQRQPDNMPVADDTPCRAERKQQWARIFGLILCTVFFLGVIIWAGIFAWDDIRYQWFEPTEATVHNVETKMVQYQTQGRYSLGGVHDVYYWFADVEYEVEGKSYRQLVRVFGSVPSPDTQVEIFYNPSDPTDCFYDRESHETLYYCAGAILLGMILAILT